MHGDEKDMRQTRRDREKEMFIFTTGLHREKRNEIALHTKPERRRMFGL